MTLLYILIKHNVHLDSTIPQHGTPRQSVSSQESYHDEVILRVPSDSIRHNGHEGHIVTLRESLVICVTV